MFINKDEHAAMCIIARAINFKMSASTIAETFDISEGSANVICDAYKFDFTEFSHLVNARNELVSEFMTKCTYEYLKECSEYDIMVIQAFLQSCVQYVNDCSE